VNHVMTSGCGGLALMDSSEGKGQDELVGLAQA